MTKMIMCKDLEREFFKNISPTETRSSTPIPNQETEDERCARANFQWFLSSLSVPVFRDTHPFKMPPNQPSAFDDNNNNINDYHSNGSSFGMGLSLVAMLTRLKVENDRRQLFASIYKGPISNRGKVRLN